jgi:hypothetical protein
VDYGAFRVASLGGYPIPHDSIGELIPGLDLARSLQTTFEPGFGVSTEVQAVVFPTYAEALGWMTARALSPYLPTPPSLGWQAVVTPVEAPPSVQTLWEAFVGVPPPSYEIALTARIEPPNEEPGAGNPEP